MSFKNYYNCNTFNTKIVKYCTYAVSAVLNLIITGIPSIQFGMGDDIDEEDSVLNLIITGIPSIHKNAYETLKSIAF